MSDLLNIDFDINNLKTVTDLKKIMLEIPVNDETDYFWSEVAYHLTHNYHTSGVETNTYQKNMNMCYEIFVRSNFYFDKISSMLHSIYACNYDAVKFLIKEIGYRYTEDEMYEVSEVLRDTSTYHSITDFSENFVKILCLFNNYEDIIVKDQT